MSAPATIPSARHNKTADRGKKTGTVRVPYMRRQRIHPDLMDHLVDLTLLEIQHRGCLMFEQHSTKRFERWVDANVIEPSGINLGRARSRAAHQVVKRILKGRLSDAMAYRISNTKLGTMKVRLTANGMKYLKEKAIEE